MAQFKPRQKFRYAKSNSACGDDSHKIFNRFHNKLLSSEEI